MNPTAKLSALTAPTGQDLRLFNSFSRSVELFTPIDPTTVRLYSCGPTVYNHAHLGNLRAYVFTDTLRRTLNWKGWSVNHVINITDVGHLTSDADEGDDKMEAAARKTGKTIWDVAAFYTQAFKSDLVRLNILTPTLWSVATDHIQDMIAFARVIEARGLAYELDGGLYFDTSRVPDYGRLAGHNSDGPEVARIEHVEGKRRASDFAIWRRSAPDENRQMEWVSPWGAGAPGWHLECSVMSMKYLGTQFDIHTGGIDHREIHHCNEIAQNQAYTGSEHTGANFWMHNNFLVDREGKMSKSRGGFATLDSVSAAGIHPLAYRLLCLSAHYRSELEFSAETVLGALTRLKRLAQALTQLRAQVADTAPVLRLLDEIDATRGATFAYQRESLEGSLSEAARGLLDRFDAAVSADLMVPQALPLIDETIAADIPADEKFRVIASMDLVLGLGLATLDRKQLSVRPASASLDDEGVERLLDERATARAAKDWGRADSIRDELVAAGIDLMDGDALRWEWKPRLDG